MSFFQTNLPIFLTFLLFPHPQHPTRGHHLQCRHEQRLKDGRLGHGHGIAETVGDWAILGRCGHGRQVLVWLVLKGCLTTGTPPIVNLVIWAWQYLQVLPLPIQWDQVSLYITIYYTTIVTNITTSISYLPGLLPLFRKLFGILSIFTLVGGLGHDFFPIYGE